MFTLNFGLNFGFWLENQFFFSLDNYRLGTPFMDFKFLENSHSDNSINFFFYLILLVITENFKVKIKKFGKKLDKHKKEKSIKKSPLH